ncbi:MAG: hypothetical protein IJF07_01975 [Lachnospiraceae bacterium]|nr:hypothetical protein [Lachnospiraceae bacterium]
MKNDKNEQLHKLYEESEKMIMASIGTENEFSSIKDETKRAFYLTLRDFFMQQKQRELIKKGCY